MTEYITNNRDRATAVLLEIAEDPDADLFMRGDAASTVLSDEQEHRRMDEEGKLQELIERIDRLEEEAEEERARVEAQA